jgi:hypothetical protein
MKSILALFALMVLAQCHHFKLPKPGEPLRNDIDERQRRLDAERLNVSSDSSHRYTDPNAQAAFDAGYSAGYLDHQRGKTSDPDAHLSRAHADHRAAFVNGYESGYAK